jgi:hypothetical protein
MRPQAVLDARQVGDQALDREALPLRLKAPMDRGEQARPAPGSPSERVAQGPASQPAVDR